MKKFFRLIAVSLLFWLESSYGDLLTNIPITQLPQLHQEAQHATVSERVTSLFIRSHYRQFVLDATFSSKIFDRYLNMLDYRHNVLLASDFAQFAKSKAQVGKALKSGKLSIFYSLYNLTLKRRFDRYTYALSLLERPMNFTGTGSIELDRSKTAWPKDQAELDRLWNEKVIYDELSLKLDGKTEQQIRDTLNKRYHFAIKRLTQSNSEDVFQLAMNALAHQIDPHTNYLSPHNTEQFNTEMSLYMEGIGAVLQIEEDYTFISSMVPGGPAVTSKSIMLGDRIVGVGQENEGLVDVIGWRLDDVVALIKGPKGTKVRLEILPVEKGAKTHTVTLTRKQVRLEDRAAKMTIKTSGEERVGVIDIPGFYVGLTDDVKVCLQKIAKQNIKSVIVDLRNNGGGALTEAVSLSGLFIPKGPVVQIRDNNGNIREDADTDGVTYYKGPLVVLVDRFSASASEIFAAVMQDYGRALIVGEPTFGKGTVQQYRSLNRIYDQMLKPDWPTLGSVQYTIQKFYRVSGGSTQRKGVIPDIPMLTGINPTETGEALEDNAMPWDSIKACRYIRVGDMMVFISQLIKNHIQRIANNQEFQSIIQYAAQNQKIMKEKSNIISLNLSVREKENLDKETFRLLQFNDRFQRAGKKSIKLLNNLKNDYKQPASYLDETVYIALDLAHLKKEKL